MTSDLDAAVPAALDQFAAQLLVDAKPDPKKVRVFPTPDIKRRYGRRFEFLKEECCRAIGEANAGLEIHFLKFAIGDDVLALASRIDRKNHSLDIEVDVCSPSMTDRVITAAEYRAAVAKYLRPARS